MIFRIVPVLVHRFTHSGVGCSISIVPRIWPSDYSSNRASTYSSPRANESDDKKCGSK